MQTIKFSAKKEKRKKRKTPGNVVSKGKEWTSILMIIVPYIHSTLPEVIQIYLIISIEGSTKNGHTSSINNSLPLKEEKIYLSQELLTRDDSIITMTHPLCTGHSVADTHRLSIRVRSCKNCFRTTSINKSVKQASSSCNKLDVVGNAFPSSTKM